MIFFLIGNLIFKFLYRIILTLLSETINKLESFAKGVLILENGSVRSYLFNNLFIV